MTHRVYLGLGSNQDPLINLDAGLLELHTQLGPLLLSSVYRSAAVGFSGPDFLNMVVGADVDMGLDELSSRLRAVEFAFGRDVNAVKFSSRTLDIDILAYDDYHGVFGQILLPRPEIWCNAHVLCPFAEIAHDLVLPGMTTPLADLWAAFDQTSQPLERVHSGLRLTSRMAPLINSVVPQVKRTVPAL